MKIVLDDILIEKNDIVTLEQGSADRHKGRQFSMVSSQADGSFQMAFIIHQSDNYWCATAEYLYGSNYHEGKYFYFETVSRYFSFKI